MLFLRLCTNLCILASWITVVCGQNWLVPYLVPQNYSTQTIPTDSKGQLAVRIQFKMNKFQASEAKLSITSDLLLCLKWQDYRLESLDSVPDELASNQTRNITYVRLTDVNKLWTPNIAFRNGLSASVVSSLAKVQYIDVWPAVKKLSMCSRLTTTTFCSFNLARFPFDYNFCDFQIESTQRNALDEEVINMEIESVETPSQNGRMRIRNYYIDRCVRDFNDVLDVLSNVTRGRAESCAAVRIELMRHMGYWVIRYFAPTFFMVCCSFIQLWLPINAWPARLYLTCSVLLTLITVSLNGYNETPAPYMTAFYWWFWGMQLFIYLAILEYATAQAWSHFIGDKLAAKAAGVSPPDGHYFGHHGAFRWFGKVTHSITHFVFGPTRHYEDHLNRNKVDYIARLVFPFLFFIFVFSYLVATVPAWSERYRS